MLRLFIMYNIIGILAVGIGYLMVAFRGTLLFGKGMSYGVTYQEYMDIVKESSYKDEVLFNKTTDKIWTMVNNKVTYRVLMWTILWPIEFIYAWNWTNELEYEFNNYLKELL